MLIFSDIIKHIIEYNNKFLYYFLWIIISLQQKWWKHPNSIFLLIIKKDIEQIWDLLFMNLNKLNTQNKNINLYIKSYILFVRNGRKKKKWHLNKYPGPSLPEHMDFLHSYSSVHVYRNFSWFCALLIDR